MPAATAARRLGGEAAAKTAMAARPVSPSAVATWMNWRESRQSPQCGTASSTKWEAMPSRKAGSGRRTAAPISAPERT